MTRTIAALIAAATIANVAVPAAAQTKYYARERIVSAPTSTATPPKAGTTCAVTSQNRYPDTAGMNAGQLITIVDSNTTAITPALVKSTCEASKTGTGVCWMIPYGTSKPNLHEIYWSPGTWALTAGSARGSLAFAGQCSP